MNEFSNNDDYHLHENSKSSSYLKKRLRFFLNANDTIADKDENVINSLTNRKCFIFLLINVWTSI